MGERETELNTSSTDMQLAAVLLKSQVQEVKATGVSAERSTARQMGFEEVFSNDKPQVSIGRTVALPAQL